MDPLPAFPLRSAPFAHVFADDFLEPEFYEDLERTFPLCEANSGPTGYSLFRGDPAFDALLVRHEAWRLLSQRVQCQSFIDYVLGHFAEIFAEEALTDLRTAAYSDRVESRRDKELPSMSSPGPADELFVRMDILQGRPGYSRAPHLDHRRRAATMLIYFSDQEADGIAGGELILIGRGRRADALTIPVRRNRMVMFPCHNDSVHAVRPIVAQRRSRNFLQITVSSSQDLWRPVHRSMLVRVADIARRSAAAAVRPLRRVHERRAAPDQAVR